MTLNYKHILNTELILYLVCCFGKKFRQHKNTVPIHALSSWKGKPSSQNITTLFVYFTNNWKNISWTPGHKHNSTNTMSNTTTTTVFEFETMATSATFTWCNSVRTELTFILLLCWIWINCLSGVIKEPFNISLGTMIGARNWGKPQSERTWHYITETELQKINVKWPKNFKSINSKWRFHFNYICDKQQKHTNSIFYVLESIEVDVSRGQSCTKYVHCARCRGCRHNPDSRTWSFSTGITCFPLREAILLDKSLNLGQMLIFR